MDEASTGWDVECPHELTLPVMGLDVTFSSNDPAALQVVDQAYGASYQRRPAEASIPSPAVRVKIVVGSLESSQQRSEEEEAGHRADGRERLELWSAHAHGVADTRRGESLVRVTEELLQDADDFVDSALGPMTLFQLGALDREPVHAVAVHKDGRAIVLAGPSGVGKSTLAYAARSEGFEVLGDEPVFAQLSGPKIWCLPSPLRLPVDAVQHFPELDAQPPVQLPNGKRKRLVALRGTRRWADWPSVCLLQRSETESPRLEPISPDELVHALGGVVDEGYAIYGESLGQRLRMLSRGGAWRLRAGASPQAAAQLLGQALPPGRSER